jgi:tetratricopeptide (TPR) repeat protein
VRRGRATGYLGYERLAQELRADELSPQLATALGRVLVEGGGEAVPLLTAAQARFPQDFWLNFQLGWALYREQRVDEAIGYYRAALALRPDAGVVHNNLGVALRQKGWLDEAIGHYEQAVRLDPKSALAHTNLGNALHKKGRLDEAIGHYQQAIRLNPGSAALAHTHLGNALHKKGRLDEAIEQCEQAVRLDPKLALAHTNLGAALESKGRLDEAIGHYEQAVRLDPKLALPHTNLGAALHNKGRLDEAIEQYEQAIRLDPKSAGVRTNLGYALENKGRFDEAIGHYQQAIRLDPKSAVAHANLATCLYAAACAAVRDAAGPVPANAPPEEPERARLRWLALDRLRADLALRTRLRKDGKAVYRSLTDWQTDPALASVRDREALEKLPADERQQWRRLWADVAALIAADPIEQGQAHIARQQWAQAAECYARALQRGPRDEGHFWFEYAAVLLLAGDRPGYAQACARMVERCGQAVDLSAYHVARACTLAPDAVAEASRPGRLAEAELKANAGQFWSLTEQGALHYRAGRFQQAVPLFEQSLRADPRSGRAVLNWLWLALAQQRLGKAEEARRWLGKAQAWLDRYGAGTPPPAEEELGVHLHNWLEAHVLRREAEALLGARPTGPGEPNPATLPKK